MRKFSLLFVSAVSALVLHLPVYANHVMTLNKHPTFNPVDWSITQQTGGFSITNQTSKNQFVQVVLNTGSVAIFKKMGHHETECLNYLGGPSVKKSAICELAPNQTLYVDKDFANVGDATGTYQVEMVG